MFKFFIASLCCFALSLVQDLETRTWKSKSGSFSTEASMVAGESDKLNADVVLLKSDGEKVTVSLEKLDSASRKYVRDTRRELRKKSIPSAEDKKPKTSESKTWNWRGPNLDGIADESGLLNKWTDAGPELLWTANGIGNAMSSLAIADNMIFTMGNRDGREHVIALNLDDGKEVWGTPIGTGGDSNSTPTVDGEFVFAIGLAGDLACLNAKTGEKVWSKSFAGDFGGKMMSEWGYSESPLIDGDRLICTPGGPNAMIVALDKATGKTIWKTPMNPGGSRGQDGAGYSSVVISNAGGVKQYITLVGRGLISVAARDGKPLWQYEKIANGTANVPTPIVDGDLVFCSSGYDDGGTALLKITGRGKNIGFKEVYYYPSSQLQNHHGGMVKIGDYIYMGEGHNNGFPMCVDMKTGRKRWEKQRGAGTGSAAIVAADGQLYFRYENGVMALIDANPKKYQLKGSFKIASHHRQAWSHPVIYKGKLYLRDQHQLHCYSIAEN
ncbi:MAG: PQQ-binding-like beta-propeller repeat protein [Mariniblastus sp.]